jgi:hypothetical protein
MIDHSPEETTAPLPTHAHTGDGSFIKQAALVFEEQLLEACKKGHYSTVKILVDKIDPTPFINCRGSAGDTPLHWAANNGDTDIAELLLDKGADVNAKTDCGVTPLHLACYHGCNKGMITLLLDRGSHFHLQDDDGYTAVHYAGTKEQIVDMLVERGAEKDVVIQEIMTAASNDDEISIVAIGSVNVSKLYKSKSRYRRQVSQNSEESQSSTAKPAIDFDVFLSHCWGEDEEGRDNHARVALIHEALKLRGVRSWFDGEYMDGNLIDKMSQGIDRSNAVVVFVTRNYINKVAGLGVKGDDDNCKMEFEYAKRRKGKAKMLCVIMEDSCRDQTSWDGPVGFVLGGELYYSFKQDELIDTCIDALVQKIRALDDSQM